MLLPLVLGFIVILSAAAFHNFGLQQITRLVPRQKLGKQAVSFLVFALLALVHIVEIGAFAACNYALATFVWQDSFVPDVTFADIFYFSGMTFTTLGFTQMELVGPMRIVAMLQSLSGFMLLTWSAGYLYAALGKYWRGEQ